ncbi:MAG: hypothetical protein J4432_01865 [DPANN group archaeon]|nr:hypothetical protein [DPANN group archaeon]
MKAKELVIEEMGKLNAKLDGDAIDALSEIMHELCSNIIDGAKKISEYSNKESVDAEAVKIAAYVDNRLKNLDILKRL